MYYPLTALLASTATHHPFWHPVVDIWHSVVDIWHSVVVIWHPVVVIISILGSLGVFIFGMKVM